MRDGEEFTLTHGMQSPSLAGGRAFINVDRDRQPVLIGNEWELEMDAAEAIEFLRRGEFPVVYRGDIHWCTELAEELGDGREDD